MPYRKDREERAIKAQAWIEDIRAQDPCLGRILIEAAVAHDAAMDAGAHLRTAPKACRKVFGSARETWGAIKSGKIPPGTEAAWKRAADAHRKFVEALDCASRPPDRRLHGSTRRH